METRKYEHKLGFARILLVDECCLTNAAASAMLWACTLFELIAYLKCC